mgnify:CR=1 FL=1
MSGERLNAGLLVGACLRAAVAQGKLAAVLRKGDPDSGMIFVKALARNGTAVLYTQTRDDTGESAWRRAAGPAPEADIDQRLDREANIDRDLWAVEILDDALAHPLDPKLVDR